MNTNPSSVFLGSTLPAGLTTMSLDRSRTSPLPLVPILSIQRCLRILTLILPSLGEFLSSFFPSLVFRPNTRSVTIKLLQLCTPKNTESILKKPGSGDVTTTSGSLDPSPTQESMPPINPPLLTWNRSMITWPPSWLCVYDGPINTTSQILFSHLYIQ